MICNLQEEIDPDLDQVFERSRHDWLGYQDIQDIFHKRDDLVISTEPVQFPEEGLFFNTVNDIHRGVYDIRYKLNQCPLVPIAEGMTSTYEKRTYRCQLYGASRIVHYRSHHEVDTGDDETDTDTSDEDDDSEDLQNDDETEDDDNEDSQNDDETEEDDTSDEDDESDSDSGGDDINQDVEVPIANGVCSAIKRSRLRILQDKTGLVSRVLPVHYWELLFALKKLSASHCAPLLQSIKSKLHSWTTISLYYAGTMQLLSFVIAGITNFWTSIIGLHRVYVRRTKSHVQDSQG